MRRPVRNGLAHQPTTPTCADFPSADEEKPAFSALFASTTKSPCSRLPETAEKIGHILWRRFEIFPNFGDGQRNGSTFDWVAGVPDLPGIAQLALSLTLIARSLLLVTDGAKWRNRLFLAHVR
jgi:hypothetical protein